jgi:hypothetical protein
MPRIIKRERFHEFNRRQLHDRMDFAHKNQFFPTNPLQSQVSVSKPENFERKPVSNQSSQQQLELKRPTQSENADEKDQLISKLKEMIGKLKEALR